MTIAICFSCGALKFGAFCPCDKCGASPTEEDELAVSLMMTDRRMRMPELENLSEAMMRGEIRPVLDERTMEALRPAVRETQRMLGLAAKA
jgi:hypothetical protein